MGGINHQTWGGLWHRFTHINRGFSIKRMGFPLINAVDGINHSQMGGLWHGFTHINGKPYWKRKHVNVNTSYITKNHLDIPFLPQH